MPGDAAFDELPGGDDPALRAEVAHRTASLLVRGARSMEDEAVTQRIVRLADDHGLDTVADLWASAPPDSLPGALWRLYLLRSWVYADPTTVAREFEEGQARAQVARVVSGVADPPGPEELKAMIDQVLRGIVGGDFADVLFRAAAFARVVAAGRATLPEPSDQEVRRMLGLAEQLESAGHLELARGLA